MLPGSTDGFAFPTGGILGGNLTSPLGGFPNGAPTGAGKNMDRRSTGLNPKLRAKIDAIPDTDKAWDEDELGSHLEGYKGMNPNTVSQRLRDLRRMARHPIRPVILHGTRSDLVASFYDYMTYRVQFEKKAPTAIRNDFKAVRCLGDLRGVPREVWPRPPTVPRKARTQLPTPEMVRALLQADYVPNAKNSYENQLVKYLLVLDFGLGLRFPNEAFALKVSDFDPATHTLVVTEPKKGNATRRLLIEPTWMCCSKRHASLANYLKWRSKVDVGGTDAFFLKPDGQPFPSKFALKRFLDKRVKKKFPWFHLYLGRTWSANARLIEWGHNHARVANWLGHDGVDMLRKQYEQEARLHEQIHGKDWLLRAFQAKPIRRTEARKPVLAESSAVSLGEVDAPAGDCRAQQEGRRTVEDEFIGYW